MKNLIKLSETHYIVVDDSEIKENDFIYYICTGTSLNPPKSGIYKVKKITDKIIQFYNNKGVVDKHSCKKITHSTQPDKGMENVTFISLSEVEELVKDKLFTIEDLRRAFDAGNEGSGGSLRNRVRKYNGFDEYITNELGYVWDKDNGYVLPPKTEWEVEITPEGKIVLL